MTTLIFDWSDWDGPATGHVIVTRRTWRRAPESLHVPWQVVVPVDGRATLDVAHVAGEVVSIRWAPRGTASRTDHVLIPDGGEHLAHLLETVDPSTLEPLPEDLPSAVDLVARAEALVARIESGEFTGAAGADGRGITSVEMVGATARFTWTDGTTQDVDLSALAGDDGDNGVGVESVTLDGTTLRFSLSDGTTRDVDAAALRGKDGHTPNLAWDGTRLVVDGVPGPSLKGDDGHTPVPTWQGTALSWDGGEPVDLRGASGQTPTIKIGSVASGSTPSATITGTSPDLTLGLVLPKGDRGDPGAPGVVSSASSYVLVGPGRPDTPSTTGGVITGAEPVGAEYRSTDGAQVGAFVWMKRPGNKWVVMSGEYTRQVGRGNGATYHEDRSAYQYDLRLGFTPGLVYIALGMDSPVDSGKHLILPGIRALMPNFSFNSYSSLPAPLREYYGNITISGPVGAHGAKEDHMWVLPIVTWPTTAMGIPA